MLGLPVVFCIDLPVDVSVDVSLDVFVFLLNSINRFFETGSASLYLFLFFRVCWVCG